MDLKDLSYEGLYQLIGEYDAYIQSFDEEVLDTGQDKYQCGCRPVCIHEFLNNDFSFWFG